MRKDLNSEDLECPDDSDVIDEAESDLTVAPIQYDITSYGADFDVEGLVRRLERGDVFIPQFQRDYVWTQREASRFVESLLLGLPVPGIFLAKEPASKKLLVIDGQQRLKSLAFFFEGVFDPRADAKYKRVFKLLGVQGQYEGKTYETLKNDDRVNLNDSVLHATIVKQESPEGEPSCIYHIFERLNTTGRKLSPQQIRVAIYHGPFIDLLHELNSFHIWREIFGPKSKTLKDEELILRFLSLYYLFEKYSRPMQDFLNTSTEAFIRKGTELATETRALFIDTISFIFKAIGDHAFKPERTINAAVYDSIMVGTARRLASRRPLSSQAFSDAYRSLLRSAEYVSLVSKATADDKNMARRLELATMSFMSLEPKT
jgi:hypothetical protein